MVSEETTTSKQPVEAESDATPPAPEPAFGWTSYAELINGRFAMIGFLAILIIELLTHQSFWVWLGIQ